MKNENQIMGLHGSDHLLECMEPQTDWPCKQCWEIDCECTCICDRLRACEQRVMEDDVLAAAYHGEKGFTMGYTAALNSAEAAVAELPLTGGWTTPDGVIEEVDKAKAVAVIRALKEKS